MCKKRPHHNVCKSFPKVSFCNIYNIQIFQKIVTKIVNIQMRHFGWFLHPVPTRLRSPVFWCKNSISSSTTWFWKIFLKYASKKGKGKKIFLDQNSKMSIKPKMTSTFDKLCRVEKLFFLSHFLFLVSDPN